MRVRCRLSPVEIVMDCRQLRQHGSRVYRAECVGFAKSHAKQCGGSFNRMHRGSVPWASPAPCAAAAVLNAYAVRCLEHLELSKAHAKHGSRCTVLSAWTQCLVSHVGLKSRLLPHCLLSDVLKAALLCARMSRGPHDCCMWWLASWCLDPTLGTCAALKILEDLGVPVTYSSPPVDLKSPVQPQFQAWRARPLWLNNGSAQEGGVGVVGCRTVWQGGKVLAHRWALSLHLRSTTWHHMASHGTTWHHMRQVAAPSCNALRHTPPHFRSSH
eukprot:1160652-Pelagomonas_calceolata.AAC.10